MEEYHKILAKYVIWEKVKNQYKHCYTRKYGSSWRVYYAFSKQQEENKIFF